MPFLQGSTALAALTWGSDGNGGSGTWNTSSANWWNGSSAVKWTTGEAIFAGTAGTVTLSGSVPANRLTFVSPGYDVEGGLISGAPGDFTIDAQADATVGATIFADTTSGAFKSTLIKAGTGVLTVTDLPAFFGTIAVTAGELRFADGGSLNGTKTYTLADAPGVVLSFSYHGEAVTNLSGGGANGGVVRPVDLGDGDTKSLTIYGGGATFGGSLQDNGTTKLGVEKTSGAGAGTSQTLNGTNTYSGPTLISGGTLAFAGNGSALNTGAITIRQNGRLLLDNSDTSLANRISTTAPVTLQGGTIAFVGSSAGLALFENLGTLSFSGSSEISVDIGTSGDSRLTFAGLQRSNLGTIHFSSGDYHVAVTGATNTNGILGAYATIGDDWATVTNAGGGPTLAAFTAYATDINSATSTANVKIIGGELATSATRNSLKLIDNTLSIALGATLTLTSGGILTSGAPDVAIVGSGKITSASASNDLIITNSDHLTIETVITNTTSGMALTKSGAGALTLLGTNTYTGTTLINEGILEASRDANLGSGATIFLAGGTLRALGSFVSTKKINSGTGLGGTIDTNGYNLSFSGPSSVSFTKEGTGTLTFSSSLSSNSVSATVNAGTLALPSIKFGSASLNSARLEAAGALSSVYSSGSSTIAPGGANAGTLTIGTLQLDGPVTFAFDVGSGPSDFVAVTSEYRDYYGSPGALFDFLPSGTIALGTPYSIMSFAGFSVPGASSFALSPDFLAAGWKASFNVAAASPTDPFGTRGLTVTFSAVPEPGILPLLAFAGISSLLLRMRLLPRRGKFAK